MLYMRNNFNPKIWGPSGWFFIDSIVLSYPDNPTYEDKNIYKTFLLSLKNVLPCHSCRVHYTENLMSIPLSDYYLSSKVKLIEWIIKMHNKIKMINKNTNLITFDSFLEYYEKAYNNNDLESDNKKLYNNKNLKNDNFNNIFGVIMICLIVFCCIYLICHKKN